MWASVTDGGPTLTQLWFKTLCRYMGICYPSLSLTRQCVRVTYISPMPGHCVRRWPTFKRHWGLPIEHDTLKQCWFNVGSASQRVGQHKTNINSMCRVCWVVYYVHVLTVSVCWALTADRVHSVPTEHKAFVWHLCSVGPTSNTLGRRCTNVRVFCVCCHGQASH